MDKSIDSLFYHELFSIASFESAKAHELRGCVGYVGLWVAWVKFLRGLCGLRWSKYFLRES